MSEYQVVDGAVFLLPIASQNGNNARAASSNAARDACGKLMHAAGIRGFVGGGFPPLSSVCRLLRSRKTDESAPPAGGC